VSRHDIRSRAGKQRVDMASRLLKEWEEIERRRQRFVEERAVERLGGKPGWRVTTRGER